MLNEQVSFSCDGFAANSLTSQSSIPPTVSTSNLCSLAADLAVNQILRVALPLGAPALDACVELCGFTNRCVTSRLARNANCPVDHARWNVVSVQKSLTSATLGELSEVAAVNPNSSLVTFTIDGFNWIESGACQCASPKVVRRFAPTQRKHVGRCSQCQRPVLAQPIFTHRAVTSERLGDALQQPLGELGVAKARGVLVSNGGLSVLFREPNNQFLTS
jgi:hypothetical protein